MNCYILEGHEPKKCADIEKWGMWFATADRKVAVERVGKSEVSTVFLGKDHSFGCGDPVLFETMVFEGPLAGEQERYSTWDEAEVGHKRMVERAKAEEEA